MGRSPSLQNDCATALKLLKYNRILDFAPASGRQIFRQTHGSITHAQQPVYACADRFEKPPHLAIAPLAKDDTVRLVAARTLLHAFLTDGNEGGDTIFKMDSGPQFFKRFRRDPSVHSGDVLTVDFVARVHEAIRELAGISEKQKAGGIDVQAADRDPPPGGKASKHVRPALRIAARDELAHGLVVHEDAGSFRLLESNRLSIDLDRVRRERPVAELRRSACERYAARFDPGFDLTP
jgi:hypothetical protein